MNECTNTINIIDLGLLIAMFIGCFVMGYMWRFMKEFQNKSKQERA